MRGRCEAGGGARGGDQARDANAQVFVPIVEVKHFGVSKPAATSRKKGYEAAAAARHAQPRVLSYYGHDIGGDFIGLLLRGDAGQLGWGGGRGGVKGEKGMGGGGCEGGGRGG